MIRKLSEMDRQSVLTYLYKESEYNIFIIGDIEHFGFDTDFQEIYAEFNHQGEYESVLLYYREHAVYYSHKTQFNTDYITLFNRRGFDIISGKTALMELVQPHVPTYTPRLEYFCKANSIDIDVEYDPRVVKVVQTKEDAGRLFELMKLITEFSAIGMKDKDGYVEAKMKSISMGMTVYIEEDGMIVASAATTADTTKSSMIVGVATHPHYRKRGYASILVHYLMNEYIHNRNKSVCLFYDNPKAGNIYLRLGFVYQGTWTMLTEQ